MKPFGTKVEWITIFVVLLTISLVIGQDYDDYGRRNRRRRPQNQHSPAGAGSGSGPCGRFLGLTYLNFNYNVDCGGGGHGNHGGGGSIDDFLGGNGGHGSHGGHGGNGGFRPQKPNRPFGGFGGGGGQGGALGDSQNGGGGFFNRPIWGTIGNFATNIGSTVGNTVGSFTNGFNDVGGGSGGHFFDGSIINSFAGLFSNSGGGNSNGGSASSGEAPYRPQVTNNRPDPPVTSNPVRPTTSQTTAGFPNIEPHPVVPIVDLRPVHEEYYDEVTEPSLYGSTNSKFLDNRYVSGGGNHHNHNGGLFDINYNRAFKKFNRNINQAFNYLFRR